MRRGDRKLIVPFVTGGISTDWTAYLDAYARAGADAIEIGLPFSDPMLDGPIIQRANDVALAGGAGVRRILADLATVSTNVPLIVMTYYNLVQQHGPRRFCAALAQAGVRGLIVPDVPLEELDDLEPAAAAEGVDLVLLAAPSTPPDRLRDIAGRSRGFVYAVSLMGTTGVRDELAPEALDLAATLTACTDLPVLLGLGISTARHAIAAARAADGVVIGSILMRQVLDGADPATAGAWLAAVRRAVDQEFPHARSEPQH
ncbi:tryptophan synthase subunit alpha [Solwaraspora sp. WMMD406]|nr:tryptophan synthase subunit alpha [Solwaraspora sp. WMMD406]MDG4767449.1 tryptophan synthase subunit alpha [Solwaraspora sp. WMMD406]